MIASASVVVGPNGAVGHSPAGEQASQVRDLSSMAAMPQKVDTSYQSFPKWKNLPAPVSRAAGSAPKRCGLAASRRFEVPEGN